MSMGVGIDEIKREISIQEFWDIKDKYYIYIKDFYAVPMRYRTTGIWAAYQEAPMVGIEFENGVVDERNINELMSCYTLQDCKAQCERLNANMEQHRNMWKSDKRRIEEVMGA